MSQSRSQRSRALSVPERRALVPDGVRDPTAATQQLSYSSPGMRQIPEWDADSAIREAYLSSVIVFACVRTRAFAFSGCPLRAVLPGQDVTQHDPTAPLARLLGPAPGGPNRQWSARRMWANAVANKIVTGKFAWELEMPVGASASRADWAPVAAWPLIARAFDAVPTDGGSELFEYFTYGRGGYAYGGPQSRGNIRGEKVRLEVSQVFYCYTPSMNDVRQAESALQAARYDIASDVLQSVYDVAFLRNDARPAGIIVHEAFEDAAERRAFRQQFEANHRGPQNANRAAFMETEPGDPKGTEGMVNWVQIGVTQRDAQMLAQHQAKAQRICIGLSTPMGLLDASGRTFDNADAETRNFWLDTMLPDLADMEDEINLKLAPRLGRHVAKFDLGHVKALQEPPRFTSISFGEAIDRQVISAAEAREEIGFAGPAPAVSVVGVGATLVEKAEVVAGLVQAGWDPPTAAKIAGIDPPAEVQPPVAGSQTVKAPALKLGLPSPGAAEQMNKAEVMGKTWAAALVLARAQRDSDERSERHRREWRAADGLTRSQEAAWVGGLRRLFARQQAAVLKRLSERGGRWAKVAELRASQKPYGDVEYADPGYQKDGKARYPIDTEAHAKAAWSYINQGDNASAYSSSQLAKIKAKIKAALKRFGVDVSARATEPDPPAQDVNPDEVFDPQYWRQETTAAVTGLFETLYAASAARVTSGFGMVFDINDPKVMAQINARASELARSVTETTYGAIREVILTGIEQGSSIPEITRGVEHVFETASRDRAEMIARTETIRASADGALAAYEWMRSQGMLDGYGKVWLGTEDARECPACRSVDGEVVAFDEPFSNGEQAPPDHPNCRCAIATEPLEPGRGIGAEHARTLLLAINSGALTAEELVA